MLGFARIISVFRTGWRFAHVCVGIPASGTCSRSSFCNWRTGACLFRCKPRHGSFYANRPNHCSRHLEKINGHNSTYVKVWLCTFGRITQVLMGKSWGKMLQCQAEMFIWLSEPYKFWQLPISFYK